MNKRNFRSSLSRSGVWMSASHTEPLYLSESSPDIHQLEVSVTPITDLEALERGERRNKKNILPLLGMEPSFLDSVLCSLVTVSTWHSQSHYHYYYYYYYYYYITLCVESKWYVAQGKITFSFRMEVNFNLRNINECELRWYGTASNKYSRTWWLACLLLAFFLIQQS
jgi:hypothetical protein